MARFFLLFILSSITTATLAQEACTIEGKSGECIAIKECEPLLQLVIKRNRTSEETRYLRNAHCGFEGTQPKVCCPTNVPKESEREDEPSATECRLGSPCLDYFSCPRFAMVLQNNVTLDPKDSTKTKSLFKEFTSEVEKLACNCETESCVCCDRKTSRILEEDSPNSDNYTPMNNMDLKERDQVTDFLPDRDYCGKDISERPPKIPVNVVRIDEHPWNVLIEYKSEWNTTIFGCGGSLISNRIILTAAHCVSGKHAQTLGTPTSVRIGEFDKATNKTCQTLPEGGRDCNEPEIIIPIKNIIVHEDYNPEKNQRNDIALVKLNKEIRFTDFIRPVCLPVNDIELRRPTTDLTIVGWSSFDILKSENIKTQEKLNFSPLVECQRFYPKNKLWVKQICAGGRNGTNSCRGDSGSPLLYLSEGSHEVHGILSFGRVPCSSPDAPAVYTKVFSYLPWIYSKLAII